jgi:hypothetical protein
LVDFIKCPHKQAIVVLSISEELNTINNVDVVLKVPCTKITEEVGTSIRKVNDKILGQSNKSNVLRLLNFSALPF